MIQRADCGKIRVLRRILAFANIRFANAHDCRQAVAALKRCRSGSIAPIFASLLLPGLALMGGMLDFSLGIRARDHLQAATDAAALATAKFVAAGEADAIERGKSFFHSNFVPEDGIHTPTVHIKTNGDDKTVLVTASSSLDTRVLGVVGVEEIPISATSEAAIGGRALEVALVLDNTGSMRNDIGALRQAGSKLARDLFKLAPKGQSEMVKIAVVPYVGTVNVGDTFASSNLDTDGESSTHGIFFENHPVARKNTRSCRYATYARMLSPAGRKVVRTVAHVFDELIGIRSAAAVSNALPDDHTLEGCFVVTPAKVNHFDLFDKIKKTDWKGCVEARPEPYDVSDVAPDRNNPDTLFVPFFWPDETDHFTRRINARNSYITDEPFIDDTSHGTYVGHEDSIEYRWRSLLKYQTSKNASIKESNENGTSSSGPNKGCPDPLQPLTTNHGKVTSAIADMTYWPSSGTIISEGLMWGWRVLSPGAPFTEGRPYDDNVSKVMVLMTDGNNELISNDSDGPTVSDYSAYGYIKGGHFPANVGTIWDGRDYLNNRMTQACTNAKAAGITIYTVAFHVNSSNTRSLLESCATSARHYYKAESTTDLANAFDKIGKDITELRLTK